METNKTESKAKRECPFCGIPPIRFTLYGQAKKVYLTVMCNNDDCPVEVRVEGMEIAPSDEALEAEYVNLETAWDVRA